MRLIITGCEYTGKTTLVKAVAAWIERTMGKSLVPYHDHFTIPNIGHGELTDEEYEQVRALSPRLKMMIQNHQMLYHLNTSFFGDHDNIMVGFHIENAIYGPLYYGYEDDGTAEAIARNTEGHIMEQASDMVMVMLKARPEVIARRMKDDPQLHGVLQEKDVEHVLKRFDEEFKASTIRYKFVLDTSDTTAEETFNQFVTEVQPLLRESDMLRMLTRRAVEHGG